MDEIRRRAIWQFADQTKGRLLESTLREKVKAFSPASREELPLEYQKCSTPLDVQRAKRALSFPLSSMPAHGVGHKNALKTKSQLKAKRQSTNLFTILTWLGNLICQLQVYINLRHQIYWRVHFARLKDNLRVFRCQSIAGFRLGSFRAFSPSACSTAYSAVSVLRGFYLYPGECQQALFGQKNCLDDIRNVHHREASSSDHSHFL